MLSRKFTTRERALLLVLAVLLVSELYFLLVHQRVEREFAEAQSRTEAATISYEMESVRAAKKRDMLVKNQRAREDVSIRPLPDFDNSTNVVAYLNGVMSATDEYSLVFNAVDFSNYVALRPISMSFRCPGYAAVREIVGQLENGPYYCEVTGLSMSAASDSADMTTGMVSVQMVVVFYEYAGGTPQSGVENP